MSFYQDRLLPHLVNLAMRNRQLLPYRERVIAKAEGRVLDMKPANRSETEQDNGAWRIAIDFDTRFCDC